MSKREILNRNALGQFAPNKQTITLNQIQKEVIVGTLLGDACIPRDRRRPGLRVQFAQTIARAEYIWHLYDLFRDFVGAPPRVYNIRGGGAAARDRQQMRFQTYSHPEFKFYDSLFYTVDEGFRRKKRVAKNIGQFLTVRALAYWDDGDSYQKPRGRAYRFNTQSFTLEDQSILVQALRDNFEILATIQKQRSHYILYIRSSSTQRFLDLIRPAPCFFYKIQ